MVFGKILVVVMGILVGDLGRYVRDLRMRFMYFKDRLEIGRWESRRELYTSY